MSNINDDIKSKLAEGCELFYDKDKVPYTNESIIQGIINHTSNNDILQYGDDGNTSAPTSLSPELFTRNVDGWDIKSACEWLAHNGIGREKHVCAKYVRSAIDIGFGTNPNTNSYTASHGYHMIDKRKINGRPNWAWRYISYLPTIGFKFMGKVNRSNERSFNALPGDIACYQQGNSPRVPGHICMFTGVAWTSDFTQKSMFVYSSTNEAYLFRYV